jgi:phenylalanyl-tRNA synthetase beta chain
MVYVYAKKSLLNRYIGENLNEDEIEETLKNLGLDLKGKTPIEDSDDIELKIELTAEKLDMISPIGIARAIKYYRGIKTNLEKYNLSDSNLKLIVEKSAEESRPKTVAAIIRGFNLNEELLDEIIEIQEKIHESFGRGRKKAAIGIYPMEKIKFPISYGSEEAHLIRFRPLESDVEMEGNEILKNHDTGKKYAHLLEDFKKYPVFRDANGRVLSMPPIINSHDTGRVELSHSDLFIECSGYNINFLDNILKVLVTSFIEMGAKAQSMKVEYSNGDVYELNLDNLKDKIDIDYVNSLIGISIDVGEAEKLLEKMQYRVTGVSGNILEIEIPPYRSDVWSSVDIADDIARAYGYNNILPSVPNVKSVGKKLDFSIFKENFSDLLTNMGFLENYTYILSSSKRQFDNILLDKNEAKYESLIDSADDGINMTRIRIFPELLESLHINRKNRYPQKVFENGFTIEVDENSETGANNKSKLASIIIGPKSNYTQIKEVLDTIFKLNLFNPVYKKSSEIFLIEGRRADIFIDNINVGFIGELKPEILNNFGLLLPVSIFEIDLDKLFELKNK